MGDGVVFGSSRAAAGSDPARWTAERGALLEEDDVGSR